MGDFQSNRIRKARREHRCALCSKKIPAGEKYRHESGIWEGEFFTSYLHISCDELIDAYIADTGENEWDADAVEEWAEEKFCSECIHGTWAEEELEDWEECQYSGGFYRTGDRFMCKKVQEEARKAKLKG